MNLIPAAQLSSLVDSCNSRFRARALGVGSRVSAATGRPATCYPSLASARVEEAEAEAEAEAEGRRWPTGPAVHPTRRAARAPCLASLCLLLLLLSEKQLTVSCSLLRLSSSYGCVRAHVSTELQVVQVVWARRLCSAVSRSASALRVHFRVPLQVLHQREQRDSARVSLLVASPHPQAAATHLMRSARACKMWEWRWRPRDAEWASERAGGESARRCERARVGLERRPHPTIRAALSSATLAFARKHTQMSRVRVDWRCEMCERQEHRHNLEERRGEERRGAVPICFLS